ncbi:MAG: alpha/beta hydrolase [Chloroflexota bacterium]
MRENEVILKRQKYSVRFKNEDMDFMLNWMVGVSQIIGLSPSQVFHAIHDIKDGDPTGWRNGFHTQGRYLIERAQAFVQSNQKVAAGQFHLGAAYAYRAALQYTDPTVSDFEERAHEMENAFQNGIELIGVPMRPIEVPFENTSLPGYYLEHDNKLRPVVMMVGGGDTSREDLFYFAGYPGWKRGYNVIMVDLPGQGLTPNRGQHFRVDMDKAVSAVLNWVEAHAAMKPEKIAVYGVSGGGYFTAQGVVADARIKAWVAATPIFDMVQLFKSEFGSALRAPGWILNTFMKLTSTVNESSEINLRKYAWQFGTTDFKSAIDGVMAEAKVVDYSGINCPSLFLVSEGEAPELKRQAYEVYDNFVQRGVNVTLRDFTAEEGADAHCELNNLRLLHLVVFDWLDQIFGNDPGDVRLRC